ncbi:hypothetical protein [Sediminibacterium ginsengisoli]|uniref:SIR2-like domain-containing protein n=1 Tax=Sediminibacterium ginsengisoli TaxID=413434 RepID=A0A1T4KTQ3_9BACT|nr:hypothetical protein [Sediminibacterium ginsengisoli]SJZ45763.1 hypothetical protein SAMN04488132_102104 [Sediminibacterium ginsengisoli]
MKNITYLLGAGASAFAMPVINNMRTRITCVLNKLEDFSDTKLNTETYFKIGFKKEFQPEYDKIRKELIWLFEESEHHQTVDTLAKKLYHTDEDGLLRLKRALIFYFLLEQLIDFQTEPINTSNPDAYRKKDMPDKRYDSFIASILKNEPGKVMLKAGISIITWNYDMQFELSFKNYKKDADAYIFNLQKQLQVVPSRYCIESPEYFNTLDENNFSIVKLNGQALFYNEDKQNYRTILDELAPYQNERLNNFFHYSRQFLTENWPQDDFYKMFNFCWEHNENGPAYVYKNIDKTIAYAKKIAEKTEILVIIGYSFPFFNRETDSFLINNMKKLQTVYIQDMPNRVGNIVSLFKSSFEGLPYPGPSIIPVSYIDSFFLPPQL